MSKPFLKWTGGKQRSLKYLDPLVPKQFRKYYEPMLGGGALFLHLAEEGRIRHGAVLSDVNEKLIETWQQVKDRPEEVIRYLEEYEEEDSKAFFYDMRVRFNLGVKEFSNPGEFGAAFIYINRATYNGIYRVNKSGHFNAPFSDARTLKTNICKDVEIRRASLYLNTLRVELRGHDYVRCLFSLNTNDFAYVDPPYDGSYVQYTSPVFDELEQCQLSECIQEAAKRGAHVLTSNADTPFIRELYKGFNFVETKRANSINSNPSDRGSKGDLAIATYGVTE